MEKIPTVEKFLTSKGLPGFAAHTTIKHHMIEFAKLHVTAAIKECIESSPYGSSSDTVSYEDVVEYLTDCYPLDNIK